MAHLERCAACREVVAAQSGDDFLARLRVAHAPGSTPTPARLPAGQPHAPNATQPPVRASAVPNLPPELAANPQYGVVRELGRGGMGVVYLAHNRLLDRREVLKVVNQDVLERAGGKERFLREIQAAARLSHANVVTAYAALPVGGMLAFAMEYVEGLDLAKVVKAQGPLPVANACYYVHQAALGLQHAHEKGMVHRDIKPQNLMLAREGKRHVVKVLDFGLAKVVREEKETSDLTGAGKMLGTPDYIAPEQTLDAARADIRADIYSLGCTLYYLLTGGPPFKGNSLFAVLQAHHTEQATPVDHVRPEVPAGLATVVAKMLAKDPGQRYQKPAEVAQALLPFVKAAGKSSSGPPPAPGVKAGESRSLTDDLVDIKKGATPETAIPSPFKGETLNEGSGAIIQRKKQGGKGAAAPGKKGKKWSAALGVGLGGVLLASVVALWAGGMFRVQTKEGVLVVQVNVPNPDVYVDGEKMIVTWAAGGKKAEIRVKPGTRKVSVTKDGFTAHGEEVALQEGLHKVITVRLERKPPEDPNAQQTEKGARQGVAAEPPPAAREQVDWPMPGAPSPLDPKAGQWHPFEKAQVGRLPPSKTDAALPSPESSNDKAKQLVNDVWLTSVRTMSTAKQLDAVSEKLRQLNPGFDGKVGSQIENDFLVQLQFPTDAVVDISPVRALPGLQRLNLGTPSWKGKLADVKPLQGLQLTWLSLQGCREVWDLTPLKGMPITWLDLNGCGHVQDLTPLQGMPVTGMILSGCSQVRELAPLRGMKLNTLGLWGCREVRDLTPLRGMPLTRLDLDYCTQIRDLTPLQGMKLTWLHLLDCREVRDLTPLAGMPLEQIRFSPRIVTKGIDDLRRMTGLKTISIGGDQNQEFRAEVFWKKYDAGEFNK
jgi:serine/threonine protein kinase